MIIKEVKENNRVMANEIKKIELMYFENCPSWKETYQYLDAILNDLKISTKIHLVNVETNEDAVKYEFPVSKKKKRKRHKKKTSTENSNK